MVSKSKYEMMAEGFDNAFAEDEADHHRNAPRPHQDCLYGIVGEIARAGSESTEANPFAIAASAIAYLGVAIGRGPYFAIGDDWNHTNLFFIHVGRSSRGRKGTSKKLVISRIADAVEELSEHHAPQIHKGGLSTREGLAQMIHDGYTQGRDEVPPIDDKRLLAVESEFANVLQQSQRNGNTLSTAIRDAWDGTSIKPAIKTSPVWASNPHIGILADVTPSELRSLMAAREMSNGFANRFIFFWAEGDKVNPFPKSTPKDVVQGFARRISDILLFAGAERHVDRNVMRMEFSPDASSNYAKLYRGELRDRSAGEAVTGLLDRRAPMLIRLAMIFAITDKSETIEAQHLNAGMAWVRYWVESVKYIFQSAMDEVHVAETNEVANALLAFLQANGKASRTQITKTCFSGHIVKEKLDAAIEELLSATPPLIEVEAVPRPKGETGSATKFYKLCAKSANSANSEDSCGSEGVNGGLRSVRNVRNVESLAGIQVPTVPPEFAEFAEFASTQNTPSTRINSHTSHISQSSQGFPEKAGFEAGEAF